MKQFLIAIGLLVMMNLVHASEPNKIGATGVVMYLFSSAAIIADWGTTLNIEDHPNVYETNKYLGPHPSRRRINQYFTTLLAVHTIGNYLIAKIPSAKWRTFARYSGNVVVMIDHGGAYFNNIQLGLKLDF